MTFDELVAWAGGLAQADILSVERQIREYGAIDLEMMGMGLLETSKIDASEVLHTATDSAAMMPWTEDTIGEILALVFYLQGKIARAMSAIAAGQLPKLDTRKDIRVYATMLEFVFTYGHWGVDTPKLGSTDTRQNLDGFAVDPREDPRRAHR